MFSGDVIVDSTNGTPQLTLDAAASEPEPDRTLDYTSGSGTNTLTFEYTVQSNDTSTNLEHVKKDSLKLNSGTIQDDSGKDVLLNLPTIYSLSDINSFKIDTTEPFVPEVSIVYNSTDNNWKFDITNIIDITSINDTFILKIGSNNTYNFDNTTISLSNAVISSDINITLEKNQSSVEFKILQNNTLTSKKSTHSLKLLDVLSTHSVSEWTVKTGWNLIGFHTAGRFYTDDSLVSQKYLFEYDPTKTNKYLPHYIDGTDEFGQYWEVTGDGGYWIKCTGEGDLIFKGN